MMKKPATFTLILVTLALSACAPLKPNPEFSACANSCTSKQDQCMINATTAGAIESCNTKLDTCMQRCEQKHSRYLK